MAQNILVEEQKADGPKLIAELVKHGFPVAAAAWVLEDQGYKWYLYIVSPFVDKKDTHEGYRRILPVIQQIPPPLAVEPFDVKLIGTKESVGAAIRDIQQKLSGTRPVRYTGSRLGKLYIEEAYVYPPLAIPEEAEAK
jgi:hypothetical protein